MNFVRSRLGLVSLVVAWPLAQLAGCTEKDREYGPLGEGGEMNGGQGGSIGGSTGGAKGGKGGAGGTSGKGAGGSTGGSSASDAGGMAGDQGSGGTIQAGSDSGATGGDGTGGSSGGKGGKGGSAGSGDGGKGGLAGGGNGGSAGGAVCVPTGTEDCGDGVDNDCDGRTDCLVLNDEFPQKNGAASGADVRYVFAPPASGATFECRNTKGDTGSGAFGPCASGNTNRVSPFTAMQSGDATLDGLWTTQVRLKFPDGSVSEGYSRTVYIHSSLNGATRCMLNNNPAAFINAAKPHLADEGEFTTVDTIRQPFVEVDFDPPESVDYKYDVGPTDGTVRWPSLRRQFTLDPDHHYLVMTRTYTSRNAAGMGCAAAVKRVHLKRGQIDTPISVATGPFMEFDTCAALVFNKKGAGYCLTDSAGTPTSAEHVRQDGAVLIPTPPYSAEADNFAWRKMVTRIEGGWSTNFSPKCDVDGCESGDTLYLPDSSFFPYWAP